MSEKKEGSAGVTTDEVESAKNRTHDLDNKAFITTVKKIVKAKKIRVNKYIFKEVSDGTMLKMEVEKFVGARSMGSRWIKGYLSETKKVELETLLDAIPKKMYIDTRDGVERFRPEKMVKIYEDAPTDLDIADLWDVDDKG